MLRIYCDTGAYRPELAAFEREGVISIQQFKYENRNRRIKRTALPSNPTWKEVNYTWAEMKSDPNISKITWDSVGQTSDRYREILQVVGDQNVVDAKHLDSAFRAGCDVFLTNDKDDIWSRRKPLSSLTGMKVLHVIDDWRSLIALIDVHRVASKSAE